MKLVVTEPFAGHERGDFLTSEGDCRQALTDSPNSVRRVQDDPKPAPPPLPPTPIKSGAPSADEEAQ